MRLNEPPASGAKKAAPPLFALCAAFAIVYLVWGSTYLSIRFAIETLPPFLMAGVRFIIAGPLLYLIANRRARIRPTLAHWKSAVVVGGLMLVGGNGLVCWAEQSVPSGLAALLVATVPLWLVMFDWLLHQGPRPTWRIVVGLATGLMGVAVLIGPTGFGGEPIDAVGTVVLLMACIFWALGSLHSRRAHLPDSVFVATAMEMTAGGVLLLVLGTVTGEWQRVDLQAVSVKSVLAVAYLVVFGSILGLSAYRWLLSVTTSARVATYAYVNPVVAMLLGYILAGEPLTLRVLVSAAVILGAVVLVTTARPHPESASEEQIAKLSGNEPKLPGSAETPASGKSGAQLDAATSWVGCAAEEHPS